MDKQLRLYVLSENTIVIVNIESSSGSTPDTIYYTQTSNMSPLTRKVLTSIKELDTLCYHTSISSVFSAWLINEPSRSANTLTEWSASASECHVWLTGTAWTAACPRNTWSCYPTDTQPPPRFPRPALCSPVLNSCLAYWISFTPLGLLQSPAYQLDRPEPDIIEGGIITAAVQIKANYSDDNVAS